ncbi:MULTISPECIES: DUF4177 domain-containing protein [Falsihalocynthiibacter]|uniref:DUF4177 domain-containing protein n=1 Tax=Falsihalocynthiibacter TaxID=2854182 RepID=UPI0030016826
MPTYQYKVVPAPIKGLKAKGARTTDERFANAFASLMNELGREGWEYLRAETLPCEERSTFGSKTTSYQNLLVFRRLLQDDTISARLLDVEKTARVRAPIIANEKLSAPPPLKLFGAKGDISPKAPELEPIVVAKANDD